MNQKCIVTNKAQLLAAVGCAIGFYETTKIILNREHGKTEFILKPLYSLTEFKEDFLSGYYCDEYDKGLIRLRANIKRTPAECFR